MNALPRVTVQAVLPSRQDLWPADVWAEMQRIASGMSASGQDPQGLEAQPASPVSEAETPNLDQEEPA